MLLLANPALVLDRSQKQPNQTTMKKLILAMGILLMSGSAIAQSNQLSIGVDLAFPTGDFGESYGFGIGPAAGLELPFGNHLGVIGQVSYQFLIPNSDLSDVIQSSRMIPIQAGLKYYLSENQRGFYAQGLAGVHSRTVKTKDITILGVTIPGTTSSSSTFSWGLGLGIQFERLDIGGRFNSITPDPDAPSGTSSSNYFGLRVGYILAL